MIEFDTQEIVDIWGESDRGTKEELADFIDANSHLIDQNKFDELFALWNNEVEYNYETGYLTMILLLSGIDFLPYLTTIPYATFFDLPIKSIAMPDNIKKIKERAFEGSNLGTIILSNNIEIIETCSFKNCSLQSIILPDSVKVIESSAFEGCYNLFKVVLPRGIDEIYDYAFSFCNELKSIIYQGTKEEWNKVQLESEWGADSSLTKIICNDGVLEE